MKKYLYLIMFSLLAATASMANTYYSDPTGGNFNGSIWSTNTAGPFAMAGTIITAADDIVVQGGAVTFNLSSGITYCKNMTVKGGATVTTIQQATFAGDVVVENGGVILLGPAGGNTGGIFVQNLYVNTGGKVWGNDPVNSGALNVKTIRINGSQLVCDGVIGDGANNDALLIQPEGTTVTIAGSGTIDVSRIRKGAATNPVTTLIIDANVNARFGTTCIYNNQNSSTFNITVNQGKTLKCIGIPNPTGFAGTEGSISLNGTAGTSTRRQALYTINGMLECDNLYLAAISTTTSDVFKYLVASTGTLKINTQLKGNSATASTSATADLELQNGALLQLSGAVPTSNMDVSGLKNKFILDVSSTVEYNGGAQPIENKFGNYGRLTLAGSSNKTLQSNISIRSNLVISQGTVLDATTNNYQIDLAGNWGDNNTVDGFIEGNSMVNFNGNIPQSITSVATETYHDVTFNNSNGATMSNDMVIDGTLVLSSGIVTIAGGKQLKISNPAVNSLTGGNTTSFINGKLLRSVSAGGNAYAFPLGNAGAYADITIGNISSATDISATYFKNGFSNTTTTLPFRVSTLEYWDITGTASNISAHITLNYHSGITSGITAPTQLLLAQYEGVQWNNLGQLGNTGNAGAGSVTGATAALGTFTFGTLSSQNPLPIKLVGFMAKQTGTSTVKLGWSSVEETNMKHIFIQKSANGRQFVEIGTVASKNNAHGSSYAFFDAYVASGTVYYRLKIVNLDGSFQYSEIISCQVASTNTPISLRQSNGKATLLFAAETNYSARVLNLQGQCLLQKSGAGVSFEIDYNYLPAGLYMLQIKTNTNQNTFILSR